MGYEMSGLLLTQVHDLRLKGGILNRRADNTISGSTFPMFPLTKPSSTMGSQHDGVRS